MKIGDKVRFLNDVGGGVVTAFQGKDIVIVCDDNGFDIPMLAKECVVIETDNYNIARPTKGTTTTTAAPTTEKRTVVPSIDQTDVSEERPITFRPKPLERKGGDSLNLKLAFVPIQQESSRPLQLTAPDTLFEVYLINDCNYTVHFTLFSHEGAACTLRHEGEVEANTKLFLDELHLSEVSEWERTTVQAIAFKRNKSFLPKSPLHVALRIDGTKFYKFHSFCETDFFETPALLADIVKDDIPTKSIFVDAATLQEALTSPKNIERQTVQPARIAEKKEKNGTIEVDLHANELLENTNGLQPKDILEFQLKKFHETMTLHKKEKGRKIVFIHGKGEGVLRSAIIKELKTLYKGCRWQDASFREYGFGATLVII